MQRCSGVFVSLLILTVLQINGGYSYNMCNEAGGALAIPRCENNVSMEDLCSKKKCKPFPFPDVEKSSKLNEGVACIDISLDWPKYYGDLILLPECRGLYTGRRNQSTKGICVDVVNHIQTGNYRSSKNPYLASNLYLTFKDLQLGKYYFDCHTIEGITISKEVIVYNKATNPFFELVILVNGEVRPDTTGLIEGDTVLIFFRSVGLKFIQRTPECSERQFQSKKRIGCVFAGTPCIMDYLPQGHYSVTLLYYFRPVAVRDNGMHIRFYDQFHNIVNKHIILHVDPRPFGAADATCFPYPYQNLFN